MQRARERRGPLQLHCSTVYCLENTVHGIIAKYYRKFMILTKFIPSVSEATLLGPLLNLPRCTSHCSTES
jgi:hypothetical protein